MVNPCGSENVMDELFMFHAKTSDIIGSLAALDAYLSSSCQSIGSDNFVAVHHLQEGNASFQTKTVLFHGRTCYF